MSVRGILLPVTADDERLLVDVEREAEQQGLVLVTDGRELKYAPKDHIEPGYRRHTLVQPGARRALDPREPRA